MRLFALALTAALLPSLAFADAPELRGGDPEEGGMVQPVVGGRVTTGWPSTVALMDYGEAFCTGTLISPTVVLTAAHCLDDGEPETVYFGPEPGVGGTEIEVIDVEVHPDWTPEDFETTGDIALLYLDRAASQTPAPLGDFHPDQLVGESVIYVGFGETQGTGGEGLKKEANARVTDWYSDILEVFPDDGSACFGDSGGPVYLERNGGPVLVGVVSFGYADDCMADGGGNTRIDLYRRWIEDNVEDLDEAPAARSDDDDDSPDRVTIRQAGCRGCDAAGGQSGSSLSGLLLLGALGGLIRRRRA